MPYATDADVPSYVKGNRAQWREVWNSAYKSAKKKGKSDKEAEEIAFKEANGVAKKIDLADATAQQIIAKFQSGLIQIQDFSKMKTKVPKDSVAYMGPELNFKDCDFTCSGCLLWVTTNKCRILNPTDAQAGEGCTFYVPGDPTQSDEDVTLYRAIPAAIAGFSKGPFTCGRCEHFDGSKDEGDCERVQGEVRKKGCCNAWDTEAEKVDASKEVKSEGTMPVEETIPQNLQKLNFSFAITKHDEETREIEGVATAEVLDHQGEVLTYEGSKSALKSWTGNVREMHQPKAVGRGLNIKFDDENRTITVRARISKGAQDTWEKVLDGTLAMYSVSGERENSVLKKAEEVPERVFLPGVRRRENVRWTDKWRMTELSLVDSGAIPIARFDLVKEVNGEMQETDVLANEAPVGDSVQKKVLTSRDRKNLPDSAYAYVDADGKRHYPIKTASGKCDAVHVRSALSYAAKAIKSGKGADIARKAMPKIRACAKKLKIGAFAEKADLFVLTHNISKIEYQDGVCLEPPTGKDFFEPKEVLEMTKDYAGSYAQSFSYTPVDFQTAYERYCQSASAQRQYDMIELLREVIIAITMDPELDLDGKQSMVEESTNQFVLTFFEEAAEAEQEEEAEKLDKETKVADEKKVDATPKSEPVVVPVAQPPVPVFDPAAFAKSMQEAVAGAVSAAVAGVGTAVAEAVKPITERLEKLEKQPAAKADGKPMFRMAEKDGSETLVSKGNDGRMVAVDAQGEAYDVAKCDSELDEIRKKLATIPIAETDRRAPLEIQFIKVNRIKKGLIGDGVWR